MNSESNRSALRFSRIEPAQRARVVEAMVRTLTQESSHKAQQFDDAFWRWQYEQLPAHDSGVFIVEGEIEGRDTLAGYYHAPFYRATIDGEPGRVAVVQDVAVDANFRGGGVFRKLAEFATDGLQNAPLDFIYTFPNHKSIHTFLKYNGYTRVLTLRTYVLPVNSALVLQSRLPRSLARAAGAIADLPFRLPLLRGRNATVTRHDAIVPQVAQLFRRYSAAQPVALERSGDYLDWRYMQRPQSRHFIFSSQRDGNTIAAAIFKLDVLFGAPALILMDFAHDPGCETDLLRLIAAVAQRPELIGEPFALLLTSGAGRFFAQLSRIGFIRVPRKLDPRPLNLLVRDISGRSANAITNPDKWHVTLTDWDVF